MLHGIMQPQASMATAQLLEITLFILPPHSLCSCHLENHSDIPRLIHLCWASQSSVATAQPASQMTPKIKGCARPSTSKPRPIPFW
ncbi:hypothetical protein [Rubritalea tangerina]|uniref:hypothetical protein n=1 Tax=Rubritalea tangerina TaxID=430798 RepID=UPI00360BAB88